MAEEIEVNAQDLKNIVYYVGGKASTLWTRIKSSKLTYIVLAFVIEELYRWHSLLGTPDQIPFDEVWDTIKIGAIGILLRSAMGKSELASLAANPNIKDVTVMKKSKPTAKIIPGTMALVITCSLFFAGCERTKVSGEVCMTNPDGSKFCYIPQPPPPLPPLQTFNPPPVLEK